MITFGIPFGKRQPTGNDYTTPRRSIGSFRLVRGYCVITHRPLKHRLGSPWIGPHQVVRQATGHTVGIQRNAEKPIICVHVDDLKLCPGPQDVSWAPNTPTAKSLCTSTVAYRPGSHVSDMAPDPSVDVSAWGDESDLQTGSTVLKNLDKPIDLTGHELLPFYHREIIYQDCKFHPIAHLMCYRYAIANDQRTFATGIRKWSRHLDDFPTPKFKTTDSTQQWLSILTDIYTYLCVTDTAFKSTLIDTGPHPFTLQCVSPWGCFQAEIHYSLWKQPQYFVILH